VKHSHPLSDSSTETQVKDTALDAEHSYQKLVESYLNEDHSFHVRRTLDQFYYSTLDEAELIYRDKTQTVTEYFLEKDAARQAATNGNGICSQCRDDSAPLLMVDQLWLWVIDNCTLPKLTHSV
jgi:hypothetical protein